MHPDVTINAGVRYDYSSLFGDYKKALAPRVGVAWDVNGQHQTIVKANYGLFFDRNLLAAASTVPEKGGVFTKVGLRRRAAASRRRLHELADRLRHHFGVPDATGGSGRRRTRSTNNSPPTCGTIRWRSTRLLGIAVTDPTKAPVVTADNIQQLSGKTAAQAVALLDAKYPGTDFRFFDVPGGSIVGNRVLSFFPRGPLEVTRTVSRYSQDQVPYTNAFSLGVDQEIGNDVSVSAMFVHRRTRDLLTRRIINLFDAAPGLSRTSARRPTAARRSAPSATMALSTTTASSCRCGDDSRNATSLACRTPDRAPATTCSRERSVRRSPTTIIPSSTTVHRTSRRRNIFVANSAIVLPFDVNFGVVAFWRSGSAFNPRGIIDSDGDGLVDQRDLTQPRNAFRVEAVLRCRSSR